MAVFSKEFSRLWMSNARHVDELDRLVTGRLVTTLHASHGKTQPPVGFRALVRQLVRHVDADATFEVTCDCALLGELIFASGRGGIYQLTDSQDPAERREHEPLLALRNACFHPANIGVAPNVPAVVESLRKAGQRGLADRLNKNWELLSLSVDISRCALRWIHAVGRYELSAIQRWWPQTSS